MASKYSKEVFRERLAEVMKEFGENVEVASREVEELIDLNAALLSALERLVDFARRAVADRVTIPGFNPDEHSAIAPALEAMARARVQAWTQPKG